MTLKQGQHRKYLPYVFSEHGALQAANVLKSARAEQMSVYFVRAFVKMRQELALSQEVLKHLAQMDKKLLEHDQAIKQIVNSLLPLLREPPSPPKPRIGFKP